MVQLGLIAKAPKNDFGGKAGIARVERGGVLHQEVGRVAAGIDLAQDIERDLAGAGEHANISSFSFPDVSRLTMNFSLRGMAVLT